LHCAPAGKLPCMADGDIHVVRRANDWTITIEGVEGVLVSFDTEDDAIRTARRVADAARREVIVHYVVPLTDQTAA
jgi:hypothetical protein